MHRQRAVASRRYVHGGGVTKASPARHSVARDLRFGALTTSRQWRAGGDERGDKRATGRTIARPTPLSPLSMARPTHLGLSPSRPPGRWRFLFRPPPLGSPLRT